MAERQVHKLKIALHNLTHFGIRILAWEAAKANLCSKDAKVAYRLAGTEYFDTDYSKNVGHVVFDVKFYTPSEMADMEYEVGPQWDVCDYDSE